MDIDENDQAKTALCMHAGLYQWKRMPLGLVNAPGTFQRALDIILLSFRWRICLIYLDDVVIFSRSIEEHMDQVEDTLKTLGEAGISLNFAKYKFFAKETVYLGHDIKPGRLEMQRAHTNV